MKDGEKRFLIEIDKNLHHCIKMEAARKKMTMKQWTIEAIAQALSSERDEWIQEISRYDLLYTANAPTIPQEVPEIPDKKDNNEDEDAYMPYVQ